jgi:hypothetical protein
MKWEIVPDDTVGLAQGWIAVRPVFAKFPLKLREGGWAWLSFVNKVTHVWWEGDVPDSTEHTSIYYTHYNILGA